MIPVIWKDTEKTPKRHKKDKTYTAINIRTWNGWIRWAFEPQTMPYW